MASTLQSGRHSLSAAPPHLHLDFLDGIRALAALYVVFGHIFLGIISNPIPMNPLTNWLLYLHFPVDVFIVVSGFCLALPVAQHGSLRGGASGFFRRRAHRILPPFYFALALSIPYGLILNSYQQHIPLSYFLRDVHWIKDLLLNIFLLQDFFPKSNLFNGVFWSVAVEWKIYFLFPLFVWLWQRFGWQAMLAAAACIGYGLIAVLHVLDPALILDHTCPWYVFLFADGVCAARFACLKTDAQAEARWLWAAGALMAIFVILLMAWPISFERDVSFYAPRMPVYDTVVGLLTACGLVALAKGLPQAGVQAAVRCLSWKPLTFLGTFAYSIYLIHAPILGVFHILVFGGYFHSPLSVLPLYERFAVTVLIGVPLILACAYLFFLTCERPFLNTRRAESHAAP